MIKKFIATSNICAVAEKKGCVYWRKSDLSPIFLISGSADMTVKYWSLKTDGGDCLKNIKTHTLCVNCLLVLPSGFLVTGSNSRSIKIWNTASECIGSLIGHASSVHSLAYYHSNLIVSGSNDTSIKIWDIDTQECKMTFNGHKFWVSCLLVLSSLELLSGSADKTIKMWNLKTGECIKTLLGHTNCIASIHWYKNELISASSDKTIKIWNIERNECTRTLLGHKSSIECMLVLPNGSIVSGSMDKTIKIWDSRNGYCIKTILSSEDLGLSTGVVSSFICFLLVLPSGELISSCSNGMIKVKNLKYF